MFGAGRVVFDQQLSVSLPSDAHIVVAAAGEGVQLGIVYGAMPVGDERGDGASGADMPVAVANPIYVDVDGNGFKPNGDTLGLPVPVQPGHHRLMDTTTPISTNTKPRQHQRQQANKLGISWDTLLIYRCGAVTWLLFELALSRPTLSQKFFQFFDIGLLYIGTLVDILASLRPFVALAANCRDRNVFCDRGVDEDCKSESLKCCASTQKWPNISASNGLMGLVAKRPGANISSVR